jgi:hypothetical protein
VWYTARLGLIDLGTGNTRELYKPQDQLGWPAPSPAGKYLAIVEAVCSDRWFAAADLHLIEARFATPQRVDTRGVDVTYTEWRSDRMLLLADPARLGVTGGSYGGFMTSWLITQDPRLAAAVSVALVTSHVSAYLLSNIPQFKSLFLGGRLYQPHRKILSAQPRHAGP